MEPRVSGDRNQLIWDGSTSTRRVRQRALPGEVAVRAGRGRLSRSYALGAVGWNLLAIRTMAIAHKGMQGNWLEDAETGRRLKAVDDAEQIPMTVLEHVPGPTDLHNVYQRHRRDDLSSAYNIRKLVAFGEAATGAVIAGASQERTQEGVELGLNELLELEAKIRRTGDAASSEPGTSAFGGCFPHWSRWSCPRNPLRTVAGVEDRGGGRVGGGGVGSRGDIGGQIDRGSAHAGHARTGRGGSSLLGRAVCPTA